MVYSGYVRKCSCCTQIDNNIFRSKMKRYYLFKPLQIIKKRERTESKGYSPLLPNANIYQLWNFDP